jgi:aminoglycoside phosphotransferase (APT) family kinase protein
VLRGFSNHNFRVEPSEVRHNLPELPKGTSVKVRVPVAQQFPFDQAIWSNEADILQALNRHLPRIPRVLLVGEGYSVHTYVSGEALRKEWEYPSRPPDTVLKDVADFLASLASVPSDELPPWPVDWPKDGDCKGFLLRLVQYTDEEVSRPVGKQYGTLLAALGFPDDAMSRFRALVLEAELTPRPFVALHADLHPGNLIREYDGSLHVIDWEFAMVGDPLHDLAIHLVRSGYTPAEEKRFERYWADAMPPDAVRGLDQDLRWYLDYQRVRSVYTDVVRTADAYLARKAPLPLEEAVNRLRGILRAGLLPLGLGHGPTSRVTRRALLEWRNLNS